MVTNVQINLYVDELRCSHAASHHLLYGTGSMAVGSGTQLICYLSNCAGVIWYKYLSRLVSSRPYAEAECVYSVPASDLLVLSAA